MAPREPRRSPRFRCQLLDLLEDDLLRLILSRFEVRFDSGESGRENGLQSEEAECCRQLSLTCRRISVALCFSSSTRSLTEIPRSLAAVDGILSRSMLLLEEAAKLQAALRALPPEVYHEPAENTRAALQVVTLLSTSTLLPTTHNSTHTQHTPFAAPGLPHTLARPTHHTPCAARPPRCSQAARCTHQATLHKRVAMLAFMSYSLPRLPSLTLACLCYLTGDAAEARRHDDGCTGPACRGHQVAAQVRGAGGAARAARGAGAAQG
jgi:hypothetical protein